MTQRSLAEKSAVSVSWVSMIERGEADPTWNTIARISKGLGVPLQIVAEAAERLAETVKPD